MARQYQVPGGPYVVETGITTRQYQVAAGWSFVSGSYISETADAAPGGVFTKIVAAPASLAGAGGGLAG